jgi:hypothetical protein
MFDKNSETLINWFENLESKCHKLIYEKKDAWFQGNLEETDIETAFNPLIRIYKSGKYYLLRVNVKNTKDDIPSVKIYNEKEIPLGINDITQETDIISILVIQGIKFTSRNFQIEIEIKQVMVLDNEPIFEECLIKTNKNNKKPLENEESINIFAKPILDDVNDISKKNISETLPVISEMMSALDEMTDIEEPKKEVILDTLEELDTLDILQKENSNEENTEDIELNINFEELTEDIQENDDELKEINNIDLNLDKNDASIKLKKPNQVYFELYKEARNKAKQAKKSAILAYLEAKNIKKTYMIENINDSDSDFDAEIDEVSESELEGL